MARRARRELESATATEQISIGFEEWDGEHFHVAGPTGNTPEALRCVGGEWDGLQGRYVSEATDPVVTLTLQAQQTPALVSAAQFLCVLGAERSGKTQVGRYIAQSAMVKKPGIKVFYALPRFSKSDVVMENFLDADFGRWIVEEDNAKHKYVCLNGSILRLWSMADRKSEEACLGDECDLFILEEFREMPSRIFPKAFSRTISTGGRLVIVSSPEANHMLEDIDNGTWCDSDHDVKFDVHRMNLKRNFFIFKDPKDPFKALRQAKAIYDPQRYARMVEGRSVPEAGHDFYNFEKKDHVFDGPPSGIPCTPLVWQSDDLWLSKDPHWTGPGSVAPREDFKAHMVMGMDPGATVMSAVAGVVTVPHLGPFATGADLTYENTTLAITHEFQKFDTSVVDFIQTVLIPNGFHPGSVVIFVDPSAIGRDHVVGESPVDALHAWGYQVMPGPSGDRRAPGIMAIRTRLHMQRLKLHRSCTGLINDMIKVKSLGRTRQDISRDPHGHRPDCLRYLVRGIWPERDVFDSAQNRAAVIKGYYK